ncbi:hypothetical protein KXQ82_02695 [Mucilaginibacter sp. HMF5004]|uniref:hypothetical protein n=1 Tax=Mucilaginibacter rivuli TaxID=2857527 RepID=UPI001C5E36B7|nr:hypothetical protein [Mucilaginibacter rivuli]MBW4888601.1 hypothetical protein [Mucilaginibacter rivuli]
MIKYIRVFIIIILSVTAFGAFAQSSATTSSPYSQFGIGDYNDPTLPQLRAMGGIGTGVARSTDGLSFINMANPAAYSSINLTTIDIGAFANIVSLSRTGFGSETSNNFRLGHIAFAVPTSKHSAISFGLMPYTNLGYSYRQTNKIPLNRAPVGIDTTTVEDNVYSGEGGFSKAYLGYGIGFGNFSIGANVAYIFGKEKLLRQTEYPQLPAAFSTAIENSVSVGGVSYDYGVQYNFKLSEVSRFTVGYSGSAGTDLSTTNNFVVSHYLINSDGSHSSAIDSTRYQQNESKLTLPTMHRFGISYSKDLKYMIGADFKMGQWSDLRVNGANAGLQNNQSFAVGGQITPNINSLSSYWAVVDYRLGFNYDNTYITTNGVNIKQYAATIGFGLPIPNQSRTNYYKVNIAAEFGQRGTLDKSLIKESFINIHLGFVINEKWFQKYKFD